MTVGANHDTVGALQHTHKPKRDLRSLTRDELAHLVQELGEPSFRTKQIYDWLWDKNVSSVSDMTNLSKALRDRLSEIATISTVSEVTHLDSSDGTRKYLLSFDEHTHAECVAIPKGDRLSVCVSTQAGCGMGCSFCATGASGLKRSLTFSEIYAQVLHVRDDMPLRVSSVVFMGQGEPFANYDATLRAARLINSQDGLGIGARKITISTCGVIPNILRFAKEPEQFTLAVSLHSAVQKTRDLLMPGVKRWSLLRLYDVMGSYVDITGRRPTYEYAMIRGINDSNDELEALCDFCRDSLAHVNLIQLNQIAGSRFEPSSAARAGEFVRRLRSIGVEATIRESRGADIDAACGQLSQRFKTSH